MIMAKSQGINERPMAINQRVRDTPCRKGEVSEMDRVLRSYLLTACGSLQIPSRRSVGWCGWKHSKLR